MHRFHRLGIVAACAVVFVLLASGIVVYLGTRPSMCPRSGAPSSTSFCVTPQETALGEAPLHFPSASDASLIKEGYSFTTAPRGYTPKVSSAQATSAALACASSYDGVRNNGTYLAVVHGANGSTLPQSVPMWVVDVTPANFPMTEHTSWGGGPGTQSGPSTFMMHFLLWTVNASDGTCEGPFSG